MFDYLYEWIQNIAFYLVLVTAVLHAVPNKAYKKYVRFFTGLVLILMIITPVLRLFGTEAEVMDLYEYIDEMKAVQMETEKEDIGVEEIQIEW
ncbi:stage III sporulation protein AF [Lachnospiraceae bacterium 42-17]|jgi:stage III sporulation protein AF|nr:stage III sporulation protein AF [Dorea sp.]